MRICFGLDIMGRNLKLWVCSWVGNEDMRVGKRMGRKEEDGVR